MSKKIMLFSAPWCSACQTVKLHTKHVEDLEIVNLDEDINMATRHNIKSIPALIVFDGDTEIARGVGKHAVLEVLDQHS